MGKIALMAVELEGGWDKVPEGETMGHDGSVNVENTNYKGEIPSKPMVLAELLEWIQRCYPDHVNRSCGMHIHVSFKDNLAYAQLMTPSFYKYFLQEVEKWAIEKKLNEDSIFWERFQGKNSYCKKEYNADMQTRMRGKESVRYAHLNYCYSLHKTIEVRLFPAFQKKALTLSAVQLVHDIFEGFLAKRTREPVYQATVTDDSTTVMENETVCV